MNKYLGLILGINILLIVIYYFVQYLQLNVLFPVGICILSINLLTAILLIMRKGFILNEAALKKPFWLLSLLINGALFKLAQPLNSWSINAKVLFVAGSCFAILSLFYLGKSFAISPANMPLVKKGTYKILRHPLYSGEMLMAFACFFAKPELLLLIVFGLLVISQIFRIKTEEELLKQSEEYIKYSQSVKWKLIPFIW